MQGPPPLAGTLGQAVEAWGALGGLGLVGWVGRVGWKDAPVSQQPSCGSPAVMGATNCLWWWWTGASGLDFAAKKTTQNIFAF